MTPHPEPRARGPLGDDDPLAGAARRAVDHPDDPDAAAELVRGTQRDVLRLCGALVDQQAAEDLAQEAYARVFRALPSFRGESTVRVWVLGIARRTAMDHLRRVVRQRRVDALLRRQVASDADPETGPTNDWTAPGDGVLGGMESRDLLARLPVDQRTAFVLTQLLGLPYAEAARIVGCPVGTIRSRVARARTRLVELLDADA